MLFPPPGHLEVRSADEGALLGWLPAPMQRPRCGVLFFVPWLTWDARRRPGEAPAFGQIGLRVHEWAEAITGDTPRLVITRYVLLATLADYEQLQRVAAFVEAE